VVYLGDALTFTDPGLSPGVVFYSAWTSNNYGVWSRDSATAIAVVDPGPQQGTLEIDPSTGAVTVTSSPSHFAISTGSAWTAGSGDGEGPDQTVNLELTSTLQRWVFNAKMVVDSIAGATVWSPNGTGENPTYEEKDFGFFGHAGMVPGVAAAGTLKLAGIGARTITVDFTIVDHPLAMAGGGEGILMVPLLTGWTPEGRDSARGSSATLRTILITAVPNLVSSLPMAASSTAAIETSPS
jgi:hypothetical protein